MILNIINNYLKEGCKEEYLEVTKRFAKDMLENEKGCTSFEIYEDEQLKDNVIMVIKWESEEDLKNHQSGPMFPKYKPEFKPLFIKNEVQVYNLIK
ncbi:antibiotic biosynthesis monooxygenase [Clostridium sp. C2-6-12]|uniref:putative quinol monooxygenase n=1 Tax=Clostridium sp. C2-6-12 TaxID=2698832 RepID=UPI001367FA2B|nr:antibiotic biosynthesis monooxygenase [Clostridium sp. C2-6-12]